MNELHIYQDADGPRYCFDDDGVWVDRAEAADALASAGKDPEIVNIADTLDAGAECKVRL